MSCSVVLALLLLAGAVIHTVTADPGSLSAKKMCAAGSAIHHNFKALHARLSSLSRRVKKCSSNCSYEDVSPLEDKMAAMKTRFHGQLGSVMKILAKTRKRLDSLEKRPSGGSKATVNGSLNLRLRKLENGLREVIRKLEVDECTSNPCGGQSVCEDKYDGYACRCKEHWYGEHCQKFCTPSKNVCVMLMDWARNWTHARALCQKRGGDLTIISTPAKYDLVFKLIEGRRPDAKKVYVGAYRGDSQEMVWLDGSAIDPNLWQPGQPNNFENVQDCGDILWKDSQKHHYLLNDDACTFAAPFVCDVS